MTGAKYAAGVALLFTSLSALAAETTYQFESVSKISYQSTSVNAGTVITGVLVNDTVPTTLPMPNVLLGDSQGFRCDNLINDMRKNPGLYILTVTIDVTPPNPPVGEIVRLTRCSIETKP